MLSYTLLFGLAHICLAIVLLVMMVGIYRGLTQMDVEAFRARVFLNRRLIERTWIGIFIIIAMLIAFESLQFYSYYTASDVDVIGDLLVFVGAVFSIHFV